MMPARLLQALWLLLAALLFLAATALTAARLWVPTLSGYREEAERLASEALHRPVTIERMEATWRGLNPVLKFRGVSVGAVGTGEGRLEIGQVWVGLDLWRFLYDTQVHLASLDVIGADVTVVRDRDGQVYIERLKGEGGEASLAPDIPEVGRISIHQSSITFRDLKTGRPALHFSNVTLTLKNSAGEHILNGNVMLPEQLGQRFGVHAEFSGRLEHFNDWQGRLYVTGRSLRIMPDVLKDFVPGIDARGVADVRCWVEFGPSRLREISAEVELRDLRLRHRGTRDRAGVYAADQVSGLFGWRRREAGWQFAGRDIVIVQDGVHRPATQVSLGRRDQGGEGYLTASATGLFLQDLQPLVQLMPGIEERYRNRFARLQPEGMIENLSVSLEEPLAGPVRVLWFDVSWRDLALHEADGLPGFGGLTGAATGTDESGTLWISSQDFLFRDDRLFAAPLHFDEFGGEAAWQRKEGRLALKSGPMRLMNGDLDAESRLTLEQTAGEPVPRVDLQVNLNRCALDGVRNYLPSRVMSAKGVQWLERALVSGVVKGGSVLIKGRLDQLPFDKGEGQLIARLPVTGAVLDFSPGWSPIKGLDAQVDFDGRSMDIRSRRGKIRTASITAVHAQIKDLAKPELVLEGTVQGELPVMLAELGESPLGHLYGGFVDRVESSGGAGLVLNLLVPLHGEERLIDVRGNIALKDNTLKVRPEGPALENIKGQLAFSHDGISGKGLKARLLGAPVNVDVSTDAVAGVTRVRMNGPLDLVSLASRKGAAAELVSGRSDWDVRLAIGRLKSREEPPEVALNLASNLEGIGINLPAPLGKTPRESRQLAIAIDRVAKPDMTLTFHYADLVQGICAIRNSSHGYECSGAAIRLGAGEAVLPDTRELLITGHVPAFSLTRWQPVLERFQSGPGLPVRLDVVIDELEVMQHLVRDVTLHSQTAGLVQTFTLDGPGSAGTIELTRTGAGVEKITMNLERLFLEKRELVGARQTAPAKPENFPELQVTIRRLRYNGVNLGELQLQALRKGDAVHVDRLLVVSKKIHLRATGDWRLVDGRNLSQFDMEVTDGKLASLLKAYNFRERMSGGHLSGTMNGSWQGAPWEFSPARVNGKLHLLIKNGQLLGVEPGAGRVLGLLSLHTLQSWASLDFSEPFRKGFAFDRIEGNFVLDNGNAYTNDLLIAGPAARIEISGRIGLADQDYDELVTVIPSMSSGLPLAGAIAGGPAVGGALLLAQRLFGNELENASRFTHKHYAVTGPWSNPVITPIEIPPAEGAAKTPAKPE